MLFLAVFSVSLLYFQMHTNIIPRQYETDINIDKDAKQP
jgi:hypothetical protein